MWDKVSKRIQDMFKIPGEPRYFLPSGSLMFDMILSKGRGYPMGGIIELAGKPDAGKTSLGLLAIKYAQHDGGYGLIINTERELDSTYLTTIGVSSDTKIIQSKWILKKKKQGVEHEFKNITFEDVCSIIEEVVDVYCSEGSEKPFVILWDSGANTYSKDEVKVSDNVKGESRMALRASRLTEWLRQGIVLKMNGKNILLLVLNHLKDSFVKSWYGNTAESPLGTSMKFVCLSRNFLQKIGTIGEPPIGIKILVENKAGKQVGAYRKGKFLYYPNEGKVDNHASIVYHLQDEKILEFDSNGRTEWEGSKLYASQLIERARQNKEVWEVLKNKFIEMW